MGYNCIIGYPLRKTSMQQYHGRASFLSYYNSKLIIPLGFPNKIIFQTLTRLKKCLDGL